MNLKIILLCVLLTGTVIAECRDLQHIQKADSLYDLAWEFRIKNPDSTLYFANLQKEISLKSGYELGLVNAYYITGFAYDEKLYFDKAAENFFKGLEIANKNKGEEFQKKKLYLLQCLGIVYGKTFSYDNSLKYMGEALLVARQMENKETAVELLYNIGVSHRKKGDFDLAIEFHNKSIEASKTVRYHYVEAKVYNSLGVIYGEQENFELAEVYYNKAITLAEKEDILAKDLSLFISNLGENYFHQNDYKNAKENYLLALSSSEENNDQVLMKTLYNNLGDLYTKEEKFADAIGQYEKVLALGNEDVMDEELHRAFNSLALAYESLQQYKLAYEYKSKYTDQLDGVMAVKDDLAEQNARYRMKEFDLQRKILERETMLASSEKENLWARIIIGIAALLIIYCSRLIYLYYRKISKARKIVNSYSVGSLRL